MAKKKSNGKNKEKIKKDHKESQEIKIKNEEKENKEIINNNENSNKNKNKKEEEYRITEEEKVHNLKISRIRTTVQYILPLIINIIIAIKYIPTQNNWLLIPFSIVMMFILYGWDCATRTCPKCKKWNAVNWTKSENVVKVTTEETKTIFGKKKEKNKKEKVRKLEGRCSNCGNMCESQRNKIF